MPLTDILLVVADGRGVGGGQRLHCCGGAVAADD